MGKNHPSGQHQGGVIGAKPAKNSVTPVRRTAAGAAPTRSSTDEGRDESRTMTKVLYIEHDDDNLYMLKMRLERVGDFKVLTAEDSEKSCRLAASERPDVILMDLEMPVVDRWKPVRTLKNDPQTRDIPIIGMSAYEQASEREQAIAAGCDEFDAKPIEFEHLVAAIRRVIANPK
jgi:CheY-like chemotaxis protein